MPVIITSDQMQTTRSGEGWMEITLADSRTAGTSAMVARRWVLEPGATGPEIVHSDVDQLLYVARGGGKAVVNGEELALEHESILWLEPGERYHFVAGSDGMEIVQGYAPGE